MGKKQVTIGAVLSYTAILFNIIAGFLYTPWMIRTIGDDQYALYTLALSVINIFLLDFGIGSAITKFLSNYYAREQYEEADRFMGIVYKVFIVISALIAVALGVFFFLIDGVYVKLTPEELATFKNLYIIVATYSVLFFPFTTFNGVLMANERFIEIKACNLGQKILNVALIVWLLLLRKGVYSLVVVQAVSNVIFLTLKFYFVRRKTRQRVDFRHRDKALAHQLFDFSVWVTIGNFAGRFIFNVMPTLIAATVSSAAVTVFSLAASLEGYVYTFSDAINGMFMPRVSRILAKNDTADELSALMSKVGRFHVYTIGLLYIGFICVGRQFVELWMGVGYEDVYICALLLIFPSLIDVPQQIARTTLLVSDIVKEQGMIYMLMAIVNVVLSLVLLPAVGVVGAAFSVCTAYLVRTAAFNVLYHKRLPIDLKYYFKSVYSRWLMVAALTLIWGKHVRLLPMDSWLGLLVKATLIGLFYATLLVIVAFSKAERTELKAIFML